MRPRFVAILLLIFSLIFLVLSSTVLKKPADSEESVPTPAVGPTPTAPQAVWGSGDQLGSTGEKIEEKTFSDLVTMIREGEVTSLDIFEETVKVTTIEELGFTISIGSRGDLVERLITFGVTEEQLSEIAISYSAPPPSWVGSLLINLLFMVVIFVVIFGMMKRSAGGGGGGAFGFGKSTAKLTTADQPKVTFDDVAGLPEAKEELAEVVEFLKDPEKFMALGARIPKGVILFGPPGCGKSLLARAVSGEAGVPFFSISGSQFVEMFVGVGASRVRDLFDQAKKHAPCIVFVDEIDAVGGQRGPSISGSHQERDQTLNELLAQMDGFEPSTNIVVVAATNRFDMLDPALLRAGRFDRRVAVDRPDVVARELIFEVHVRGKPLASDVSTKKLAQSTPGFTGADIENTVNEAAILAVRRGKKEIGMAEFEEAAMKSIAGPERKSRVLSEKEKRIIAYHEVGHALAMHHRGGDPVHKISIISRGLALGYTMPLPEEDRNLLSRKYLLGQLVGLLGGRAAEELIFGENEITTGASNDLQRASDYARRMVVEWGMSKKVGLRSFAPLPGSSEFEMTLRGERVYSQQLAQKIDEEIYQLLEDACSAAKAVLIEYREDLERIVEQLLKVETLEREEFLKLLS